MTDTVRKLVNAFNLSEEELNTEPAIYEAYKDYLGKRAAYGRQFKCLNEAIERLQAKLDEALRSLGIIPDSQHLTLREDEEGGLMISVWAGPKPRRGRKAKAQKAQSGLEY